MTLEKLKNFKLYVFDGEVYVKATDYKKIAVENKEFKNELMEDMKYEEKLEKENKELKRENKNLLYEIKCWYENRKERDKRMLELEEENEELKKKLDILYHHI